MGEVIKRILSNGNVRLKGELIEVWPAFDDMQQIDDSRQLNETQQFDESDGIETFFEYLFGVDSQLTDVDVMRIDSTGNVYSPEFIEGSNEIRIHADKSYEIPGEFTEGVSF